MATFSLPSTQVRGTFITSTMYAALGSWRRPPTCRVRRAAAQAFVTGVWDTVQFDTEDWDTNTIWSSTNNDQLFTRTAGKYLATASGGLNASTAGSLRSMAICKNTTANSVTADSAEFRAIYDPSNAANGPLFSVSQQFSMTTSDFLTLQFFHDRGSDLGGSTFRNAQPTLSILWVST